MQKVGPKAAPAARPRIALISEHASPLAAPGGIDSGGQNVYVSHLARELSWLGYGIDVYTRRDAPGLPLVTEWRPGVRVIHVPAGPALWLPKEKLLPHMKAFGEFMQAFMQHQGLDYQLAHANFFMSGMVALQLKLALGLPFLITFHALGRVRRLSQGDADSFPDERFDIEATLMQEAACVIAECEQDRQDMCGFYQARTDNIVVVPCGFDPEEFWPVRDSARRLLGVSESEFVILQLGRMVPRKGIDNVLHALPLLRERHGLHARLLVVGGDVASADVAGWRGPAGSPELQRLRDLAVALGVSDQVDFTGGQPRSVLRQYYSAADVFVTTPWYEPFGITPLEAMACATPVVGSAVGGIRSTVIDGETGYLVPPKDPGALADSIARLQRDPLLARRMGWNGLRRAHRHFTWRRVALQLASVYRSVTSTKRALALPDVIESGAESSAKSSADSVIGLVQ